jgi:hypothetical protein
LIKHNVDINQRGGQLNKTPICYACSKGHTDIVQILLHNNCDIFDDAIHVACERGYKDIVEILIKHNVDINQRGSFLLGHGLLSVRYLTPIVFTTTLINVNIMFYQNFNNVFITSFTGIMNSIIKNVTIIVKQNLYNICMTIITGKHYWCKITNTK